MPVAPLWTPSPARVAGSNLTRFAQAIAAREGVLFSEYDALYAWSIAQPERFWSSVWDFVGVLTSAPPTQTWRNPKMPGTTWFPGARLNFAENLLRHTGLGDAIVAVDETGDVRTWSHDALRDAVRRLSAHLRGQGVTTGDRVAAFFPNRPEAIVAMLAAASLGATYSSCSPDFGFSGVMDRFGQIAPKVLLTADGYRYGGRTFDSLARAGAIADAIGSIEQVIVVPVLSTAPDLTAVRDAVLWNDTQRDTDAPLEFVQLPFDHPLYILYSSGTTGVPKCIVHGAGGTLIQHAKELLFHTDVHPDDRVFYFTTCGWMMWNWLVSTLFTGAAVVLYDGSPGHPDLHTLWRMADEQSITHFGTSPKFLATCAKAHVVPRDHYRLDALRVVLSTGAPLTDEGFAWVYENVRSEVQLASISGGTDIVSCFMLGSPWDPVYAGEIQKRGLGMDVQSWDDTCAPLVGEKGELVCATPFPSMPVSFWDDPSGARYAAAYFSHFTPENGGRPWGTWRHGDFIEITPRGGVIVYGRSDATLNPGGVRIGTAEIYRQVESIDAVLDAVVVGQRYDGDTRVVLFVVLREGVSLTDDLTAAIRKRIRANATPRHVPSVILTAPAVPRTISGKKVELAVTRIIHGEPVNNRDALANPESLAAYANRPELA